MTLLECTFSLCYFEKQKRSVLRKWFPVLTQFEYINKTGTSRRSVHLVRVLFPFNLKLSEIFSLVSHL